MQVSLKRPQTSTTLDGVTSHKTAVVIETYFSQLINGVVCVLLRNVDYWFYMLGKILLGWLNSKEYDDPGM